MVTEREFDSIFDYSSAFKYHSAAIPMSLNRNHYKSVFSYNSIYVNLDEDSDEDKDENFLSTVLRKVIIFVSYIIVILSFPLSFWVCVKKVHSLERIVLMRLGKLQSVREPGFTFILPLIDIWTRVNLRPQTFTLSTSQLLTADGGIVQIESEVEYQVCDIVSYVTKLSKQEKSLKDLCLCCLTNIISEKDQEDLQNNKEYICSSLVHELNQSSLKWGLEILSISLSHVKILKAAEPVNVLGTLLTALKSATGQTSDHTTTVFPIVPQDPVSDSIQTPKTELDEGIVDILKRVLWSAESKSLTKDINGCFKFEIVGDKTSTAYCSFNNGHVSIVEGSNCSFNPDVSLTMTEDNVRDFLENKLSSVNAYMDGKVMVDGDWSLLRPLVKVLEGTS